MTDLNLCLAHMSKFMFSDVAAICLFNHYQYYLFLIGEDSLTATKLDSVWNLMDPERHFNPQHAGVKNSAEDLLKYLFFKKK